MPQRRADGTVGEPPALIAVNLGPPVPPDLWSLGTPKEEVMYKPIVIATGVIITRGATSAGVAAAKLTDPQIAHIVVTADTQSRRSKRVRMQRCKGLRTE
jgi:hypothetical protein